VNSFEPAILARETGKPDPILYFYEDFLQVFDPVARERYGVYYTPVEVVTYMVAALDRALRDNLGTVGLTDEAATILDPATGTGTGEIGELVGEWMDELWDDLKEPVRNAGWANQLNTFPEFSIAFWRWAIWKIFESEGAPGRGVVAFISNRTLSCRKALRRIA
jgi:hypothetical protein